MSATTATDARPLRVQLRRVKGWRLPASTVKVDRTTKWGNPFIVGEQGTREQCVRLFAILVVRGCLAIGESRACVDRQQATLRVVVRQIQELRGQHLACWCPLASPCHADVLLALANGWPIPDVPALRPTTDRIVYEDRRR